MSAISEVDIEAWREDEKQTDFLEHRRKADNHVGWAVEVWTIGRGWLTVSPGYETYREAGIAMLEIVGMFPILEFRVYEVVK